ncbi:DUF962 domain-containing protein [Pseudomonas corrugata]|uniref:DUF962 domain-containing protein n=1 Tax=Pseudomonas corrugata TaxID=47879 RepID=UPI0022319CAA|nr:DUF962 domain-containing protein [Pseudomonas corrugata]UZD97722.1 DUF962 domain-containing protein [Pseudomonas corrugata]
MAQPVKYKNFRTFYPFYLSEHSNRTSRRLHFVGTTIALILALVGIINGTWGLLLLGLVQAYAFAWIGHFFYERNRPATFHHPIHSFMGDWRMWWDILTRKIPF